MAHHEAFRAGQSVRLKHDPGRIGNLTGEQREYAGLLRLQVSFSGRLQYIPVDQLEIFNSGNEDPLDLLRNGTLGHQQDLRRTITHARLTGRLADLIYSMGTTGTDFYAHQFKPVVKLINSACNGILIADEVGLGKTIEAGLIWTELRTRYDFRRLLVLCPAVLREKWQRELKKRFGVNADILDATSTLGRLQTAIDDGPAASFAIIASLQGLRPPRGWNLSTEDVSEPRSKLARFLEDRSQDDPLIDLCVIDEAHYLRNRETMTAKLGRLVRAISDYIVLLSATPVHLKNRDLHELVKLVDHDTFEHYQALEDALNANDPLVSARDLILNSANRPIHEIRKSIKKHLHHAQKHPLLAGSKQLEFLIDQEVWQDNLSDPEVIIQLAERLERVNLLGHVVTRTRRRDVEERRVLREINAPHIYLSSAEERFYKEVTRLVRNYCMTRDVREGFMYVTPQRQMCSSMPAALRAWNRGIEHHADESAEDPDEYERPLKKELAIQARTLGNLHELERHDSKYGALLRILRSEFFRKIEDQKKIILFSYFRETLQYLHERLERDGINTTLLHGDTKDKDYVISRFRDANHTDILLSSEVGSEGLDLQFARVIINYDLPWNPMRVEQRIGRVDRLGQKSEKVHVWNMFYSNTIDERIYTRLFDRLKIFERTLGSLEPILGDKIQKLEHALFSHHLTPEQEEDMIKQTELALSAKRKLEEELEDNAYSLTAYGDYILNQVKAARDFHRSIVSGDIRSYVIEFFDDHYDGSIFLQDQNDEQRYEVGLSTDAKYDFEQYVLNHKLEGSTLLIRDNLLRVPCRFENTAIPEVRGREEVISQFHPLVRFVSSRLNEPEETHRPAVSVQLTLTDLGNVRDLGFISGLYVFAVQQWSLHGLRDMEQLHYAAARFTESGPIVLRPLHAERLTIVAAEQGKPWLGAQRDLEVEMVASTIEEFCIGPSEKAFEERADQLSKENSDRADVQERTLDRYFERHKGSIEDILDKYRRNGPARMIPATEGRLRALEERIKRRKREILERRELRRPHPMILCVGVIKITEDPVDSDIVPRNDG